MYNEINNFPLLRKELEDGLDIDRIAKVHSYQLARLAEMYLDYLLETIPEGEDPPDDEPLYPSVRLWGQRIHESFEVGSVFVDRRSMSMVTEAYFNHPSVEEGRDGDVLEWFQFGTAAHLMPRSDTGVSFWWGTPLRWQAHNPPEAGRRRSHGPEVWGRSTVERNYWARPYGDFVTDAYLSFRKEEADKIDEIYANSLSDALRDSRYLRREDG